MKKIPLLLITMFLLTGCSTPAPDTNMQSQCEEHKGKWIEEFSECEYPDSQEWCEEVGGEFQECESACRNNPEAEICTLQCVQVCQF